MTLRNLTVSVCLALPLAGCGGHKSPGSPSPSAPQITCPADISIRSVSTPSQVVNFDPPAVTGGASPVQTTCTPASGSMFALGSTTVNCTASDASSRTAMCSFKVTLSGFSIGLTKYEAFGDSLTAGETGRNFLYAPLFDDVANAYPTKLQADFDAVYPGQGITVINKGHNGDKVEVTDAVIRDVIPRDRPDAILILSGYNNLNDNGACGTGQSATPACRGAIDQVGTGIRDCIRHAKELNAGVQFIFVSTLTPPGPTGSNRIDSNAIVQANGKIRQQVAAGGAVLVDSYAAFLGHEADYVNVDGLHLKPAGYQALADTFFAAIQATVPQTPLWRTTPIRYP
ncbi:MAG TPA: GDSL-type esterase/lipase family protein [Vicinamibacterales bacterium]|nr:GDSL-type esterase/lipase family protein [Vicinamibacterales bacterium]